MVKVFLVTQSWPQCFTEGKDELIFTLILISSSLLFVLVRHISKYRESFLVSVYGYFHEHSALSLFCIVWFYFLILPISFLCDRFACFSLSSLICSHSVPQPHHILYLFSHSPHCPLLSCPTYLPYYMYYFLWRKWEWEEYMGRNWCSVFSLISRTF